MHPTYQYNLISVLEVILIIPVVVGCSRAPTEALAVDCCTVEWLSCASIAKQCTLTLVHSKGAGNCPSTVDSSTGGGGRVREGQPCMQDATATWLVHPSSLVSDSFFSESRPTRNEQFLGIDRCVRNPVCVWRFETGTSMDLICLGRPSQELFRTPTLRNRGSPRVLRGGVGKPWQNKCWELCCPILKLCLKLTHPRPWRRCTAPPCQARCGVSTCLVCKCPPADAGFGLLGGGVADSVQLLRREKGGAERKRRSL